MAKTSLPHVTIEHDGVTYDAEVARVTTYRLGREDHGIFTLQLGFEGPAWGQSLPAMALDEYDRETESRKTGEYAAKYIMEVADRLGSPGTTGQRVLVLRETPYGDIKGFAVLEDDGSYGTPFISKAVMERAVAV